MRGSTVVTVGIRNIGDSKDGGQFYEGTVKDSLYWLIEKIGSVSMADRIVIGIGRDKEGANKAIVGMRATQVITDDMRAQLDSFFTDSEEGNDPIEVRAQAGISPLDDYKGVGQ